jgi:putative flippase GtrA
VNRLRQLLRYSAVSAIATTTSLSVLGVLVGTRAMSPGWANVVATAAGTVPSFELNRRWVWGKRGQRSATAEIVPFCIMSFAGLALSTLAVHRAAIWAEHAGLSGAARTIAVEAANIAAFGSLWIAQFLILDRVLFRHPSPPPLPIGREDDVRTQEHHAVDTAA